MGAWGGLWGGAGGGGHWVGDDWRRGFFWWVGMDGVFWEVVESQRSDMSMLCNTGIDAISICSSVIKARSGDTRQQR